MRFLILEVGEQMKISEKQATQELHDFIEDCRGDELASLYGYVFGRGEATWNEAEDIIEIGTMIQRPESLGLDHGP